MRLSAVLLLVCALAPARAQEEASRWDTFPGFRNVRALAAGPAEVWAATDGGVFAYAPATGEIRRFSTAKGLSEAEARAVAYDAARAAVWVGYGSGVLDRIDAETSAVRSFFDLSRADQFSDRTVNRLVSSGDTLFVATGFGLVVFDPAAGLVRNTFSRFAGLPPATPVRDAAVAPAPEGGRALWVATDSGLVWAPLDGRNLQEPAAWSRDAAAPAEGRALAYFAGRLVLGTATDVYRREPDGTWAQAFLANGPVTALRLAGDRLLVASRFLLAATDAEGRRGGVYIEGADTHTDALLGPDGTVWVGDAEAGLMGLPAVPALDGTFPTVALGDVTRVIPDGPWSNNALAGATGPGGELWVQFPTGYGRLRGGEWTNYTTELGFDAPHTSTANVGELPEVAVDAQGGAWVGSYGGGLGYTAPDAEPVLFNEQNSVFLPCCGATSTFTIVEGVAVDAAGNVWATNFNAPEPIVVRPAGADSWTPLPRPAGFLSGRALRWIYIDSFGQKWIALRSSTSLMGGGYAVYSDGGTPTDPSDDRAASEADAGSGGVGLPDAGVRSFAEDLDGRMWIGTERGLAYVVSPGSALSGDGLARPVWTTTPDNSDWFLRDLFIYDIEVDPANRKWLGSAAGAWLVNAEGNEVLAHFTADNSPLPSDDVLEVEIDRATGAVYFITAKGVARYRGDAVAARPEAADLRVFPNPVRASGGALPEVFLDGLVDNAEVRILTVDGEVVASFRTRGGRGRWDGRDQRTGAFVPSGVYLVAASAEGQEPAYGKIAVIR